MPFPFRSAACTAYRCARSPRTRSAQISCTFCRLYGSNAMLRCFLFRVLYPFSQPMAHVPCRVQAGQHYADAWLRLQMTSFRCRSPCARLSFLSGEEHYDESFPCRMSDRDQSVAASSMSAPSSRCGGRCVMPLFQRRASLSCPSGCAAWSAAYGSSASRAAHSTRRSCTHHRARG